MANQMTRRAAIGTIAGLLLAIACHGALASDFVARPAIRLGVTTDLHIGKAARGEEKLRDYVAAMKAWKPDFCVDIGDFACPSVYGSPRSYPEAHDDQLARLRKSWAILTEVPCPVYIALGNHCVGWIRGGDERLQPADLQPGKHPGEDITKDEHRAVTKLPGRYYSFDKGGFHFIVLDADNTLTADSPPSEAAATTSVEDNDGRYYIDATQREWLAKDLESHRQQPKVVFCHQELLVVPKLPPPGSNETLPSRGGPPRSQIANGPEIWKLFRDDGKVLACFQGHSHSSGWIVHEGTCYLTLGELGSVRSRTGDGPTYSKVTLTPDLLRVEGVGKQRSYEIPLGKESLAPR